MKNIMYLASQSSSRQQLLKESDISFKLLSQDADESACDWGLSLDKLVAAISLHKMNHAVLPAGSEGDTLYIITADTLSRDANGEIQGKPKNKEDAIVKIKQARKGTKLCSAFCLDKKIFRNGEWKIVERIHEVVAAEYLFYVPDEWIEPYLEKSVGLSCSNAIAVELFGAQFLKSVRGSYSTIVGLPMYEVRQALEQMGFFD